VIGTLLFGLLRWQTGKKGFFGAAQDVDPDSLITPWLVACWLKIVICGLRRSHSVLMQWIDLSMVSDPGTFGWKEVAMYFQILGWTGAPPVGGKTSGSVASLHSSGQRISFRHTFPGTKNRPLCISSESLWFALGRNAPEYCLSAWFFPNSPLIAF